MKNKLIFRLILIIFVLCNQPAFAKVITTYSINSDITKDLIKLVDRSTVVLIDIDDTIITPKSKMFRYNSIHRSFIDTLAQQAKDKPFFYKAIGNWLSQRKIMLVEEDWANFIEQLKQTGALVFGFSKLLPATYKLLKEPEEWRYNELSHLGIHFTSSVNNQPLIKLANLDKQNALFYKGIIFTAPFAKSQVLVDFMRITKTLPRKIIIFSNRADEIKQIEDSFKIFDLDLYSIYYLAAAQIAGKPDSAVVKFQQDTLINTGKWLEDEEAERLLREKGTTNNDNQR